VFLRTSFDITIIIHGHFSSDYTKAVKKEYGTIMYEDCWSESKMENIDFGDQGVEHVVTKTGKYNQNKFRQTDK
jgi:hypothetical protein